MITSKFRNSATTHTVVNSISIHAFGVLTENKLFLHYFLSVHDIESGRESRDVCSIGNATS